MFISEFIALVFLIGNFLLSPLAFPYEQCHSLPFAAFCEWIFIQYLPMVKYTLWESLPSRVRSQVLVKTKGFSYWQITFKYDSVVFFNGVENTTSSFVQSLIHSSHDIRCACDLHQEDRLLVPGFSTELTCHTTVTGGRGYLVGPSVDRVCVQSCI